MMNHKALFCHFIVCFHNTEIIKQQWFIVVDSLQDTDFLTAKNNILISGLVVHVHDVLFKSEDNTEKQGN